MKSSANIPTRPVPTAALLPFTLITFAISWGILGLYIFLPDQATGWFGAINGKHPAFVLAVWINRRAMLTRDGAVTEVFAPHARARSSP